MTCWLPFTGQIKAKFSVLASIQSELYIFFSLAFNASYFLQDKDNKCEYERLINHCVLSLALTYPCAAFWKRKSMFWKGHDKLHDTWQTTKCTSAGTNLVDGDVVRQLIIMLFPKCWDWEQCLAHRQWCVSFDSSYNTAPIVLYVHFIGKKLYKFQVNCKFAIQQ